MEDIAANVQYFAEQHIVAILENCRRLNWWNQDSNICLAGGLFANVKINQTVSKMGFSKVFIAPAMTDDGSALGAALVGLSNIGKVHSKTISNMYLGSEYSESKIRATIKKYNLVISSEAASPESVADLLNNDKIVAIFGGRSEFGPRALGNRSILATAKDAAINDQLNRKLRRTEFMPFAPVIRDVDFGDAFEPNTGIELTSEYMTMAVDCKEDFARSHPAVVHVDGTARPQMIRESANPNYYALLTAYKELSGQIALVNTSFNVHEEPIVESPDDAIRGFLESGLDYLYFTNGILLSYEQNQAATIQVLREKIFRGTADSRQRSEITKFLEIERGTFLASSQALLVERDVLIQQREYWVARAQELELKMNS
jgi:carbamoyltransferase